MRRASSILPVFLLSAALAGGPLPAADSKAPDLTRGGRPDRSHDWTLGPTGARGWMWGRGLETSDARQILVTRVDAGSPTDGVLAAGDVILGIDGRPFDGDPRAALGRAIGEAEKAENGGRLRLVRWRDGTSEDVTVRLEAIGAYADTAPFDCPKSRRILEEGSRYLVEHGLGDGVGGAVNALALLASGVDGSLDAVRAHARKVGRPDVRLRMDDGMCAWEWGYANLFLTEYHLATGDDSVLPAIGEYTRMIARGQSGVGTWGHGMAVGPGRTLGGYGALNQAGLVCWLSMVLARKCGVDDAEVRSAIDRSHALFGFYVGKGSIPYGDHPPYWELHDNNGKNAIAAIALDLLGQPAGARFFSRLSTASYDEREVGHTGNYFSYLWGPLGVARSGPAAVAAHLREQRWYYDLARRWDGGFTYQGGAGEEDSYEGWDMTGVLVLTQAIPLGKLHITGKGSSPENRLEGEELRDTIEDGRGFTCRDYDTGYDRLGAEALIARLGSWSPTVRHRAARALSGKGDDPVPELIRMLKGEDANARLGACQALEYLEGRAASAVDELTRIVAEGEGWLRIRALYALSGIGKAARHAVPSLLRLALSRDPDDPRDMTARYLCLALFLDGPIDDAPRRGLLCDSLEGLDRGLLPPALRRLLQIDDGLARSCIASVYGKLTEEELWQLWPDILGAVETPAPSGEMFADGIRLAGLKLLSEHRMREGLKAAVDYARNQNSWGSQDRMSTILAALVAYGAAARETLPALRELLIFCIDERDFPEDCKRKKVAAVEAAIRAIEATDATKDEPPLRSTRDPAGTGAAGG